MSYSCNPNHENQRLNSDASKKRPCRFSERNDEAHQRLGCAGCSREWDTVYLKSMGFKVEEQRKEKE